MRISLKKYRLTLKHTFSISRESYDFQDTLIAALSLNGQTGYGEATSNPYYKITVESMVNEIEAIGNEIESFDFTTPELFHQFLIDKGLGNFATCALDLAAHDLYGKLLGKPLYEIWGTNLEHYPTTNYT
ncbi:MAG: dipeptide epimerase, partial [Maribacter sp.]|nr:dipeptide epimerase [Maribacter sp.]